MAVNNWFQGALADAAMFGRIGQQAQAAKLSRIRAQYLPQQLAQQARLAAEKAQYYGPTQQANIARIQAATGTSRAQASLIANKIRLMNQAATAQPAYKPQTGMGKQIADYQHYSNLLGATSPAAQALLPSAGSAPGAVPGAIGAGGGVPPMGTPARARAPLGPIPGGFIKNPMMGPARGGGGGTFYNPQTGKIVTSLAPGVVAKEQTQLIAIRNLNALVHHIIDLKNQLGKSQATGKVAQTPGLSFLAPYVGLGGLQSTTRQLQDAFNKATEQGLAAYNLGTQKEAVHMVTTLFRPESYETGEQYETRAKSGIDALEKRAQAAKVRLKSGIVLTPAHSPAVLRSNLKEERESLVNQNKNLAKRGDNYSQTQLSINKLHLERINEELNKGADSPEPQVAATTNLAPAKVSAREEGIRNKEGYSAAQMAALAAHTEGGP